MPPRARGGMLWDSASEIAFAEKVERAHESRAIRAVTALECFEMTAHQARLFARENFLAEIAHANNVAIVDGSQNHAKAKRLDRLKHEGSHGLRRWQSPRS